MSGQQAEIIAAVRAEAIAAGKMRQFKVISAQTEQNSIRIAVEMEGGGSRLEDSLEGGLASWGRWSGTVVAVSPVEGLVFVQRALNVSPPNVGRQLTVQPPKFLQGLLSYWTDSEKAESSFVWAAHAIVGRNQCPLNLASSFAELRAQQKKAYSLLSYKAGFLWGPPGTGKTKTAASIAADFAVCFQSARILLLAPTNSAVDQLLVAIDSSLAKSANGQQERAKCARVGSRFLARYYEQRRHLLPEATDEVLLKKATLEANPPSHDDYDARAFWQREMDQAIKELRSGFETILRQKRVVAMTTIMASLHYESLQVHAPFDLVIFDEGSQIGRALCLMLAPLGHRVLVCGDPNQLAPIFSSEGLGAHRWFGRTLFDEYMDRKHPSTCFLNEQSRMAEPICGLVSEMFYDGELRVAEEHREDQSWQALRRPISLGRGSQKRNLHLVRLHAESAPIGLSHHRPHSAETVATIVQELMLNVEPSKILVLTPFRPQRKLLKRVLDARGLKKVRVNTVHAAQGAETHAVIFDPVKGNSWFLRENGSRLLNVAISRAQCFFILLASEGDLEHALLSRIAEYIERDGHP